jgi:hypothetical protein
MKTITCDEAFEALTDSRANEQPELVRHLATCARCRELREVLAPALALFAGEAPVEAACPAERTAGADRGSSILSPASALLSPAAVLAADQAARRLSARHRRPSVSPGALFRMAAVFLVGVATAFGVASIGGDDPRRPQTAAPAAGACLWTSAGRPASQPTRAEDVILSCVACHLPASAR